MPTPSAEQERPSRAAVALALAALAAIAFGLRIWGWRVGLPRVFHSDWSQVDEGAQLVATGSFVDDSSYPVAHVYVYAAANLAAYPLGRAAGAWSSWSEFLARLETAETRHAIARAYTALAGACIVFSVYALARRALSRRASLLAAAIAGFSPMLVIYSHQARIHVPGITALTLAAIPVVRLALDGATARRAVIAGLACAAVASLFQLGYLLGATAGALVLARARPLSRALRLAAALGASFAAVALAFALLTHVPGVVQSVKGSRPLDNLLTLGIPAPSLGLHWLANFPGLVARWIASEPVVALGLATALALAWRGRMPRALVLAYGTYPLITMLVLGTNYTVPRYSMSITPFAAVLAVAAIEAIPAAWMRSAAALAAAAVPLATSLQYGSLLHGSDTRWRLEDALRRADAAGAPIAVEETLLAYMRGAGAPAAAFPPSTETFVAWAEGRESPMDTLDRMGAALFARGRMYRREPSETFDPASRGWRLAGEISPGPLAASALPDAPEFPIPELFLARECGPPIEIWARDETALRAIATALREIGAASAPQERGSAR